MAIKVSNQYIKGWNTVTIKDVYVDYDVSTDYGDRNFIWFEFELENRRLLKQRYGFSLHKNSYLYPLAKGFFGKVNIDIDFEELIGTTWEIFAELNVGNDGRVWTNITNVRKVPCTSEGTI